MARNYTMKEVVEIFVANKDQEAMADIGKRFPLLAIKVAGLVAKAPTEATDLFKFSPDYLSANKMNKAIKDLQRQRAYEIKEIKLGIEPKEGA